METDAEVLPMCCDVHRRGCAWELVSGGFELNIYERIDSAWEIVTNLFNRLFLCIIYIAHLIYIYVFMFIKEAWCYASTHILILFIAK